MNEAKYHMGAVYGSDAVPPSEYIQSVKDMWKNKSESNAKMAAESARMLQEEKYQRAKRGRPVSCGTGRKVSVYLPQKTLDLIDRITEQWSFESQSDLIQEAIARYAADLDGVMKEGESNG